MSNGIKLPPGHLVQIHRTGEPIQSFEIVSHLEFRAEDGTVHGQQDVFGRSFARVDVIDPATNQPTRY